MKNSLRLIKSFINKFLKKIRTSAVRKSNIDPSARIASGCNIISSAMGRYSYCGYDCTFFNAEIGSFCSIANNVVIGGASHPAHFVSTSPVFLSHKDSIKTKFANHEYMPQLVTKIGHDVWIGDSAIIKAGVTIGTGAIIGMGAVVTKSIDPFSVVGGNPARLIRKRFSDDKIQLLLKSEWWNMSEIELSKFGENFNNPDAFLLKYFKK